MIILIILLKKTSEVEISHTLNSRLLGQRQISYHWTMQDILKYLVNKVYVKEHIMDLVSCPIVCGSSLTIGNNKKP